MTTTQSAAWRWLWDQLAADDVLRLDLVRDRARREIEKPFSDLSLRWAQQILRDTEANHE